VSNKTNKSSINNFHIPFDDYSFSAAKFRTAFTTRRMAQIPEADEIIVYCLNQLQVLRFFWSMAYSVRWFALCLTFYYIQVRQKRGDYRELCELAVIFLGGTIPEKTEYAFKRPGALSKTRWMARAIYALKTWMFGRQIEMDSRIHSKLFDMCVFVCRAYIKFWFNAPFAPQSPKNDLTALQFMYQNRKKGSHWMAALKKFCDHLWYLSPQLVPLALFDDKVSVDEKKTIVSGLKSTNPAAVAAARSHRAKVQLKDPLVNLQLSDFVSSESMKFFSITGISPLFLAKDPSVWGKDAEYLRGLQVVTHFKVVNDAAERGVQLVTQFLKGNQLTTDEEQRQLLLIVVAKDRQQHNKLS